ncbi:efflux RND transporter periplasmic adaptor subunit [Aquabacterium sp. OR-4]|uniref:efflux RND transporter periplasmic adaptor subunit n=1 Tax=Aquabacterium sp. OR-4 TaxID=2978127 RepID=UPI0021B32447|nr:efflux RND transporter periplasmic adaptor subunit [Aquabacterium sp. OR-4]MDT7834251.1 efflux RND transporter periplasmic adaptor subunit [Aquabacterium sp. OR-4]
MSIPRQSKPRPAGALALLLACAATLSQAQTRPAPTPAAAAAAVVASPAPAPVGSGAAVVRSHPGSSSGIARGVVRATAEATLTARLSARITEMPLAEGATFAKGDLLVAFECERPQAEARAAAAALAAQRKQVETNEELDRFNAIGKNDLLVSKSQLDKAQAEADALNTQLRECRLQAPFAGRVMTRQARQHESVQAGAPLLRIVDTSAIEVDLIVPSQWLAWLRPGTAFVFRIDETGAQLPAKVQRLSATVDPVSRTMKITASFDDAAARVLPGMSGTGAGWRVPR